jgi:hypothetical protein
MISQSLESPNRDNFRTPSWESRDKKPFGCGCRGKAQGEPLAGREATAPSNIRIIKEVHGGEVMPPNGGIIRLENVQMKPLFPKSKLNA